MVDFALDSKSRRYALINLTRRDALRALVAAALASSASLAVAQPAYPNRPIRLVVPYPPGALTDVLARTIAERMSAGLGQPIVVENKPGAGTLVGAELVAKSPPDGYTLLMATSTTLGISPALYQPSPVNPVRDFAPIGAGRFGQLLPDRASGVPRADRARDDRRDQGAIPGKYNYASVGSGSPHHLFMETLKTEQGLVDSARAVQGHGRGDHRRAHQRHPADVLRRDDRDCRTSRRARSSRSERRRRSRRSSWRTSRRSPRRFPGFDWQAWQGIVAPAGTPKDVIARLSSELAKLQENAEFRAQLVKFGMEPFAPQTPEQFAAVIVAEQPRWVKAVKDSGAKVD